jgi:hypothetical protein
MHLLQSKFTHIEDAGTEKVKVFRINNPQQGQCLLRKLSENIINLNLKALVTRRQGLAKIHPPSVL